MSHHQEAAPEKKVVDDGEKPVTPPLPPAPLKLERMSSLDSEPKTLLGDELKDAREAALKIINSHTREEALKIFLTGLVPVEASSVVKEEVVLTDSDDDDEDEE